MDDVRLREDLASIADDAGPLALAPERVVARVKRQRQRSAVAAGGAAVLVIAVVMVAVSLWPNVNANNTNPGGVSPAIGPSYPRPFVCGEELMLGPEAAATRLGLTMSLSEARKVSDSTGPALAMTLTADRPLHVRGSPSTLFELLYTNDAGVIVGGGPMLNRPGDLAGQAMDLIGAGWDVAPGQPSTEDLGPRDTLCPGATWPQIWSEPQRYEAVLVQGRVLRLPNDPPDYLRLDIPTLGYWPLLVARARLAN